jgi:Peptidase M15
MGIRDLCTSFTDTPGGQGCYRDLAGTYHYLPDNAQITRNFAASEFNTEGCRPYGIMLKLVQGLQQMRDALGVPITVTSGYRNPIPGECGHDSSVGEQWQEPHADGLAADINVAGKTYVEVAQAAHDAGFVRIEVIKGSSTERFTQSMSAGGHVHVDVYDGTGNTTAGSMYDSPASAAVPAYPWYAYGVGGNYNDCDPATWPTLLAVLQSN